MKYEKDRYIGNGMYGYNDEEISAYKEKVVKCRKEHICYSCKKEIEVGEYAIRESGFMDGKGVNCYTCISCMEKWMEQIGMIDDFEEEV